jgi:hypothetical protein
MHGCNATTSFEGFQQVKRKIMGRQSSFGQLNKIAAERCFSATQMAKWQNRLAAAVVLHKK